MKLHRQFSEREILSVKTHAAKAHSVKEVYHLIQDLQVNEMPKRGSAVGTRPGIDHCPHVPNDAGHLGLIQRRSDHYALPTRSAREDLREYENMRKETQENDSLLDKKRKGRTGVQGQG